MASPPTRPCTYATGRVKVGIRSALISIFSLYLEQSLVHFQMFAVSENQSPIDC